MGLDRLGLLEDSLVILTADHGESTNEHWEVWDHGHAVYEETIRVPLLIRFPGRALSATRVSSRTSAIDLLPTVLEILGMPREASLPGWSLVPAMSGKALEERPIFAEASKPHAAAYEPEGQWANFQKCRAVWKGDWKLIHCPKTKKLELYKMDSDTAEQENLLNEKNPEILRMRRRLRAHLRDHALLEPVAGKAVWGADEQALEQLEVLGYLEGE